MHDTESEKQWALCLFDMFSVPGTALETELEAPRGNWGRSIHPVLFTMHAIQLLPTRWQDFLSNKTEFCRVFRRRVFSPSVAELSFQWASCQYEENEMLDFLVTAYGLIIRHSRNNCFGRSQLHFILQWRNLLFSLFFLFHCNNGGSHLEAWSFGNTFYGLRP